MSEYSLQLSNNIANQKLKFVFLFSVGKSLLVFSEHIHHKFTYDNANTYPVYQFKNN